MVKRSVPEIVCLFNKHILKIFIASSWGKPQGKTLRNGFLHEALDEMTTPQTTKNDMMQSSGK